MLPIDKLAVTRPCLVSYFLPNTSDGKECLTVNAEPSGHYIDTTVAGETIAAFVPQPLPPRLTAGELESLVEPLSQAEAALAKLDLAGEMIPSLAWFIYAFVRKEALLSSEIEASKRR